MGNRFKRFSGDSYEDTPVPMPNTVVKLIYAESTWPEAAREDRKLLIKRISRESVRFFLFRLQQDYPATRDGAYGADSFFSLCTERLKCFHFFSFPGKKRNEAKKRNRRPK